MNNDRIAGVIEYKMPKEIAKTLLMARKGDELKLHDKEYLCKVVNESYGLKNHCVNVILY